jgi:drug/metabolite transporter (DMT)-like permease
VAFAVQTYAQRFLSPTKTALILITEPAFGGIFGWFAGERLGVGGVAGAVLILSGMVVAEILGGRPSSPGGDREYEAAIEGPPVPLDDPIS